MLTYYKQSLWIDCSFCSFNFDKMGSIIVYYSNFIITLQKTHYKWNTEMEEQLHWEYTLSGFHLLNVLLSISLITLTFLDIILLNKIAYIEVVPYLLITIAIITVTSVAITIIIIILVYYFI